jgi:hypothetical protein
VIPRRTAPHAPRRASVVDLTFAIWAPVIALLFHDRLLNGDGDLARHIVVGRHILSEGPRFADPFSFTRTGEPFLAYEWLSQVMYAGIHALAGLPGVAVTAAFMLAGSFTLVALYVRRHAKDPLLAFLTGTAAALLTNPHWLARPHVVTLVALPVLLHALHARRRLPWIAVLFAAWSNLHPGFLYGLVMVALWALGLAFEDLKNGARPRVVLRDRIRLPAVAAVATLANPFGWSLHIHALGLLGNETTKLIDEFMPLDLFSVHGVVFVVVFGLMVAALAAHKEWVGWHVLLVLGAASVAALAGRRYAPTFAVFALPLAVSAVGPVVRGLPAWVFGRMRAEFARSDRPGGRLGLIAAALLVALLPVNARLRGVTILPRKFSEEVFPEAAIRTAREAGVSGRLLSEYTWGGYVLYTWPGQRLFVDSLSDFFGDDLIREYIMLRDATDGWEDSLEAREISVVLLHPEAPLIDELRVRSGWQVVHVDSVAVLLVRDEQGRSP